MATLAEVLEARTAEAAPELVEPISKGRLRCYACGHECPIPEGALRRLQGALQSRRRAARAVGLRRRRAVRSDREEALLPRASRARSPSASACSAAICTAPTARTGSRRRRCAIRRRCRAAARRHRRRSSCDEAVRLGAPRRRQHLQRAAHHQRMGGRDLQGGARARPDDGLRLERQRHAAGARLHPAVDRSLQGRSQELRRSALPPARRPDRADPRDHPRAARDGHLARDRHAADSGLQRLADETRAADRVPRRASPPTSPGT